jgi:hypothetical protein
MTMHKICLFLSWPEKSPLYVSNRYQLLDLPCQTPGSEISPVLPFSEGFKNGGYWVSADDHADRSTVHVTGCWSLFLPLRKKHLMFWMLDRQRLEVFIGYLLFSWIFWRLLNFYKVRPLTFKIERRFLLKRFATRLEHNRYSGNGIYLPSHRAKGRFSYKSH